MNESRCLKQRLVCAECGREITDAPLSFGGGFACRSCVEAYYEPQGPEIVEQECRERAVAAMRMGSRRGSLE